MEFLIESTIHSESQGICGLVCQVECGGHIECPLWFLTKL